jgi:hypothetical protein
MSDDHSHPVEANHKVSPQRGYSTEITIEVQSPKEPEIKCLVHRIWSHGRRKPIFGKRISSGLSAPF